MSGEPGLAFFPFDLPLAEFVVVYVVLGAVLLLAGKGASVGAMSFVEPAPGSGASKRTTGPRLERGTVPTGDALVAAAYLRGGVDGAADAILASAAGEGWILPGDAKTTLQLFDPHLDASRRSSKLRAKLRGPSATFDEARAAAREVAKDETDSITRSLAEQDLLRGAGSAFAGFVVFAVFALAAIGIGLARGHFAAARGESPLPSLAVAGVLAVVAGALSRNGRATAAGERYVAWLESSTEALRDDVAASRSTRGTDVATVGAVHGLEAIPLFERAIAARAAESHA